MKNRILALAAATFLTISLFTGCASSVASVPANQTAEAVEDTAQNVEKAETAQETVDEIYMAYFCNFEVREEDAQRIEDAINAITVPEIGVKAHITGLGFGSWDSQIGLMLASNEQLDLVPTFFSGATSFSNMLSSKQLSPLNELLEEYGQGILELLPEEYLQATTFDGNIYAVPSYKDNVSNIYFGARTDIIEQLGLEEAMQNIRSTDDLEAIFKAVKENTDLVPLGGQAITGVMGQQLYAGSLENPEYLDKFVVDFIGTLNSDPNTVVNVYETEAFANLAALAHDWYEKGYVYKDMATDATLVNTELIKNNKCFGCVFAGESSTVQAGLGPCGYDMTLAKLGEVPLQTSNISMINWTIPVTSQEPEAAMRFMNMMYTDARIVNLLNWGEEGIDYIVQENGTLNYPEGMDSANHKYHMEITWLFGNQYLCKIWNDDPELRTKAKEINDNAVYSSNFGFIADTTGMDVQLAGLNSAIQEYVTGLICGSMDPETALPEMIKKMKAAGSDEVVAAVQEQLDAWKAE